MADQVAITDAHRRRAKAWWRQWYQHDGDGDVDMSDDGDVEELATLIAAVEHEVEAETRAWLLGPEERPCPDCGKTNYRTTRWECGDCRRQYPYRTGCSGCTWGEMGEMAAVMPGCPVHDRKTEDRT